MTAAGNVKGRAQSPDNRVPFDKLIITSPKRAAHVQSGWDGFFPYYAGYPEQFARSLIESAQLPAAAVILDPWNGSGTTTYAASKLGYSSRGLDLNPVMSIVARARLLPPSEADSIEPLVRELVKGVRSDTPIDANDPLLLWFKKPAAAVLRAIERRFRDHLIGHRTLSSEGVRLDQMSGLAATFYVALFSVCRQLTEPYRSSNPTWLKQPKAGEKRIGAERDDIVSEVKANLHDMAAALSEAHGGPANERGAVELVTADTTKSILMLGNVDFVLTSPPYCTRIDYSAATRIELAVLHPLINLRMEDLGRRMIGSTRVPTEPLRPQENWGRTCNSFLRKLKAHPSKASAGYYFKTHLDYFQKMSASLANLTATLKSHSGAVLIVQDSFYKDIHNDLPSIVVEMAEAAGMRLRRREDFHLKRSMADINPNAKAYKRIPGAVEAVLCLEKDN